MIAGNERFPFRGEIIDINNNGHFIIKLESAEILAKPVRAKFLKRLNINESNNTLHDASEVSSNSSEESVDSTSCPSATNESDVLSGDADPHTIADMKQSFRSRRNNMSIERPDGMSESRFLRLLAETAANSAI